MLLSLTTPDSIYYRLTLSGLALSLPSGRKWQMTKGKRNNPFSLLEVSAAHDRFPSHWSKTSRDEGLLKKRFFLRKNFIRG